MLKILTAIILISTGIPSPAQAFDPLERVEQDQSGELLGSLDIFNRNIAMGTRKNYTRISSYRPGAFGHLAHDGDPRTAWIPKPEEAEGFLEISWGLSVPVNRVDILEKKSPEMPPLALELYDGKIWEPIAHDEASPRNRFVFPPRSASALRIRLTGNTTGGGIAEVEVYNTQSTDPLSRYGAADLIAAMKNAKAVVLFDGSPYAYTRSGRTLIKARTPEASLTDIWTKPVMEFICTSLGGKVETTEPDTLQITLNGHAITMNTGTGTNIMERIKALAEEAGLEFRHKGPLVMVGNGLEAIDKAEVTEELIGLLGRNPSLASGLEEAESNPIKRLIKQIESYMGWTSQPEPDAIITPTATPEGITYEWAGFRAMADPDTNSGAWLKYSEAKSARSWAGSTRYMNAYVKPEKQIESVEDFEALKSEIRAAPEMNSIIATRAFLKKYHEPLAAEFKI